MFLPLGLLAIFLFLEVRYTYNLQVTQHEEYQQKIENYSKTTRRTQGERGKIYDSDGTLLVGNIIVHTVFCEPKRISKEKRYMLATLLQERLGLNKDALLKRFDAIVNTPVEAQFDDIPLSAEKAQAIRNLNIPQIRVDDPNDTDDDYRFVILANQCDDKLLKKIDKALAPIVQTKPEQIFKTAKKKRDRAVEIILKKNIDYSLGEQLKRDLKERGIGGIRIADAAVRCYPQDTLLSNVLGYMDAKGNGLSGIEQMFDKELRPKEGYISYQKDSRGERLPLGKIYEIPAQDGAEICLTINATIQKIAEEELAKVVDEYKPEVAYAIMMNQKTGAIMALAQYPTFNPNDTDTFSRGPAMQNHCLTHVYEPGSIMKPIPISYALDQGIVSNSTVIYCEGGYWVYNKKVLRDTHRNKDLSVADIVMVSSNIGTAKIGLELGNERLHEALSKFGMGQRTGLGFLSSDGKDFTFRKESRGQFRALKKWDGLSATRFPIGQGISCTPLQILQAYGAIANGGTMMQPYIVESYKDFTGEHKSTPRVKGHPISPSGAKKITQAMIKVVEEKEGTGKRAHINGFQIAGKTGTGQIWMGNHYAEKWFTSSFVGFVPAEDPAFVMLISVRGVKVHGGTACGPVFKNIAKRTLEFLNIQPDEPPEEIAKKQTR